MKTLNMKKTIPICRKQFSCFQMESLNLSMNFVLGERNRLPALNTTLPFICRTDTGQGEHHECPPHSSPKHLNLGQDNQISCQQNPPTFAEASQCNGEFYSMSNRG